ncbi:MAG: methyltransferase domain-containing protein [Thermoplasmata archaeon]|nr:methyltransferase domain-containing protein [Thermoplasmata archaeon]
MVDDKTAEEFSAYMKKFNDLYEYLASLVQRHSSSSHPFILDLGAGPGLLSVEIFRKIPQATIIGIDPLIKMLQLANGNVKNADFQTFEPVVGVSENIPLKNNTVDMIASRFSLPYWTQPKKSFQEMMRVLKPGGKVVLEALNRDFPTWKLSLIKIRMLFNRAGRDVTKYHVDAYKLAHTFDQVEQFFTDAGFTISEKEGKKSEWRFIIVAEKK